MLHHGESTTSHIGPSSEFNNHLHTNPKSLLIQNGKVNKKEKLSKLNYVRKV